MEPSQSDLSGKIIGAAIRVHEVLGPGFLEAIHEEALCVEPEENGLKFVRQYPVKLTYRQRAVGEHRLDRLVAGKVVVELKAVVDFDPIHFAITRSYLKATGCEPGLLLNFATPTLTIKRVGREWHARSH